MLCSQVRPRSVFPPALRPRAPPGGWPGSRAPGVYPQPGSASVFLFLTQDLAEIPNCLSNRYKVSPLQSHLLSSHVPVCDAIYTSPIPTAPSRQLASLPHRVFGSLLPFTPPVLGSSLRRKTPGLDLAGAGLGRIWVPPHTKASLHFPILENQELSQVWSLFFFFSAESTPQVFCSCFPGQSDPEVTGE